MLIKNPYRVTAEIPVTEGIRTNKGYVPAPEWVKSEAARFVAAGIPAKAVIRKEVCYVIRNREGCTAIKDDAGE